ncbi:MAG: DUF4405 domain-containing protein, partial [Anaerolineaceae bacterium]
MKKRVWLIDLIAFAGFFLAFYPRITGYGLHEWLGLAVGAACLVHLIQHWRWVVNISKKLEGVKAKIRLQYFVDGMLAIGFLGIILSGLVISSLLNLELMYYDSWRIIHVVSSFATLVLLVFKLALHWGLIKNTVAKVFHPSEKPETLTAAQLSRRSFMKDAGFAGLGLLVVAGGLNTVLEHVAASTPEDGSTSTTQANQDTAQAAASTQSPTATTASTQTTENNLVATEESTVAAEPT